MSNSRSGRFNLGFGIFGPKEYCGSGKYVLASYHDAEMNSMIKELNDAIHRAEHLERQVKAVKDSDSYWREQYSQTSNRLFRLRLEKDSRIDSLKDRIRALVVVSMLGWVIVAIDLIAASIGN